MARSNEQKSVSLSSPMNDSTTEGKEPNATTREAMEEARQIASGACRKCGGAMKPGKALGQTVDSGDELAMLNERRADFLLLVVKTMNEINLRAIA